MDSPVSYGHFLPWVNKPNELDDNKMGPDDRSGLVYLQDPELKLAAEIAIVTQRPLLISGPPGSGKSSFAPFVARNLDWCYYEITINSNTEAKDLLWKFDALARLRDAQAQSDMDPHRYVTPGILWWAFNRKDALGFLSRKRSLLNCISSSPTQEDPKQNDNSNNDDPFAEFNYQRDPTRAVVLIDEIDKADPGLPNDLLEVLGLNRFRVYELNRLIERKITKEDSKQEKKANRFGGLLIIITTNQERDLPPAFIRRCIVHNIQEPKEEKDQIKRLIKIAKLHKKTLIGKSPQENLKPFNKSSKKLIYQVAKKCCELRNSSEQLPNKGPSTAEFLDALKVCFMLGINPDSGLWQQVKQNVFVKSMKDS